MEQFSPFHAVFCYITLLCTVNAILYLVWADGWIRYFFTVSPPMDTADAMLLQFFTGSYGVALLSYGAFSLALMHWATADTRHQVVLFSGCVWTVWFGWILGWAPVIAKPLAIGLYVPAVVIGCILHIVAYVLIRRRSDVTSPAKEALIVADDVDAVPVTPAMPIK